MIAVVGAGISGLCVARELQRRGHSVQVFEAEARPGGKIQSERIGEFLLESGPNSFSDDGDTLALVRELGLDAQLLQASAAAKLRYLGFKARLCPLPMSPGGLLKTRLLSLRDKLRLLWELAVPRGRNVDCETVHDFFRRRFGRTVADRFAGAFVAGVYAGDASALEMASAFPRLVALEREHRSLFLGLARTHARPPPLRSFVDGMQTLTDGLASRLGDVVHLGMVLRAFDRGSPGWRLHCEGRGGEACEIEAEAVVLALPAYATAPLVAPLGDALRAALADIPYAPVTVVHLAWPTPAVTLDGFGFLTAPSERVSTLGAIVPSNLFSGRTPEGTLLFSAMLGGSRAPESVRLGDTEAAALVRGDLARFLDVHSRPSFVRVVRHERAIPQYTLGHANRVACVEAAEMTHRGVFFAGNAYRGVGVPDCVRDAKRVADRVQQVQSTYSFSQRTPKGGSTAIM